VTKYKNTNHPIRMHTIRTIINSLVLSSTLLWIFFAVGTQGASCVVTGCQVNIGATNYLVAGTSSISGGAYNTNDTAYSIVSGGLNNTIGSLSHFSAIAGGWSNVLREDVPYSVISGGIGNTINEDAYASAINGGAYNAVGAVSPYAWIGGGGYNAILYRCEINRGGGSVPVA